MVQTQLHIHKQKYEFGTHLKSYTNINLKYIIDLNVKIETIKLLEHQTLDLGLGKDFLDMTPKEQGIQGKNR